ncbi:uncharacterized protein LOC129758001 [Uranotaenia lowii]|uniref:uncharacterized protein LOC129758001 n=1 Tax=Uranotaenia lowii TaxID=190385 RepID=UPI00247AE5D8|nr:uncharacterized protein LOC129758001 [Uranotaenia lowii]
MSKLVLYLVVISVFEIFNSGAQLGFPNNYVCTDEYCDNYRESNPCDQLKTVCKVQNSTHNGIIFPSISPCSCCEICVENLKQGEDCSMGGLGSPVPTGICGPGLYCMIVEGEEHPTCQKMSVTSPCYKAQTEFDERRMNGLIGHLEQRPVCDADGNFAPVVCIPGQTCYCIDKEGNRIFGDAVHTSRIEVSMRCECSRLAAKAQKLLNARYPIFSSRCDSKGSYEQLQCVGTMCTCVDMHVGDPISGSRNISRGLEGLPCFDKKQHDNTTWLRDCEVAKLEKLQEIQSYESNGFNVMKFNADICQPDGWFASVQSNDTHLFCVNNDGSNIDSFSVQKGSSNASKIDCKCARARKLLQDAKSLDLPDCCPNGNYMPVQCRRGQCYCVNGNGMQEGKEVPSKDTDQLPCAMVEC